MLKKLKEKLAELQAKQMEAFNSMLETSNDETIKAYEAMIKACKVVEDQISNLEQKEAAKKPAPAIVTEGEEAQDGLDEESRAFMTALSEAVAVGANYSALVPATIAEQIVMKREAYGKLRPLCRKINLAGDYVVAIDGDQVVADYIGEAGKFTDKDASVEMVSFSAYKLGAMVKVSSEFLTDVVVNGITWLTDNIARAFAKKEDAEILAGSGSVNSHITGILTAVEDNAVTAGAVDSVTVDEILELIAELGEYAEGAVLLMNAATKGKIRSLKDESGQYYFPLGVPFNEIEGHKIVTCATLPKMAAGTRAIIAANMDFYQLVDREGIDIQVFSELYAENDQKGIRGKERIDGKPLVADAFKVLVMAAE